MKQHDLEMIRDIAIKYDKCIIIHDVVSSDIEISNPPFDGKNIVNFNENLKTISFNYKSTFKENFCNVVGWRGN